MPSNSVRAVRIFVAVLIAASFIATAFYLTSSQSLFSSVTAQSTDELLEAYAAQDTDQDGLPDWQEALYGTDPNNPESVQAGVRDAEAVAQGLVAPRFLSEASSSTDGDITIPGETAAPNSLTDRFARLFFSQYFSSRNSVTPTSEQVQQFVADATDDVLKDREPDYLPASLVERGSDDSAATVTKYLSDANAALVAAGADAGKSELALFDRAIKGDPAAAEEMRAIAAVYRASAENLRPVSAPPSLVPAHAEMTSALYGLAEAIEDMASHQQDPLRAFVGIRKYKDYADRMNAAFATIRATASARGVGLGTHFFGRALQLGTQ